MQFESGLFFFFNTMFCHRSCKLSSEMERPQGEWSRAGKKGRAFFASLEPRRTARGPLVSEGLVWQEALKDGSADGGTWLPSLLPWDFVTSQRICCEVLPLKKPCLAIYLDPSCCHFKLVWCSIHWTWRRDYSPFLSAAMFWIFAKLLSWFFFSLDCPCPGFVWG